MKKVIFMLTVLIFVTSTFAVAADQKAAPKVPVQMSDAEMAQVVGGTTGPPTFWDFHNQVQIFYEDLLRTLQLTEEQEFFLNSKISCLHSLFSHKVIVQDTPN